MAALIRIVNAFFAALFLVAALVSLGFLQAALDGFAREPEDVWLSVGWAVLFTLLAALCLFNLRMARRRRRLLPIALNAAVLLLAAAGFAVGDPVARWIVGVSLLPFAMTLPVLIAARRSA